MKKALMWALWSPRNAAVAGTGLLAALIVVAVSATGGDAPAAATTPAPAVAVTESATPTTEPATTSAPPVPRPAGVPTTGATAGERDAVPTNPAKVRADARAAAQAFMGRWLKGRTAKDHAAWVKSMTPLSSPAFVPYLTITPASAIPDATVQRWGDPVPSPDYATVPVALSNGMKLEVEVVTWGGRWVVASVQEKRR